MLFLSTVLFISFAMNFYVIGRTFALFGVKRLLVAAVLAAVGTLSFIAASAIQSLVGTLGCRVFYSAAAGWVGVAWLAFVTLVFHEIIRLIVPIKPKTAGVAILMIVGLATLAAIVNAQMLRVKTLAIPGPVEMRIVQLSDIHIGSTSALFLNRVIDKTNTLNPDIVVVTGDLIDNLNSSTLAALELLTKISAPVYFVMGNHEFYAGQEQAADTLQRLNITVLRNEAVIYKGLTLVGIDDHRHSETLETELAAIKPLKDSFTLLLSHRPIAISALAKLGFNLTLAGHTHSGQLVPFNFITATRYPHLNGLYQDNGCFLYVTSGTGTWGPRMRLGSRSEIVLINIHKTPPHQ